jgi:hypothetical protein
MRRWQSRSDGPTLTLRDCEEAPQVLTKQSVRAHRMPATRLLRREGGAKASLCPSLASRNDSVTQDSARDPWLVLAYLALSEVTP